MVRCLLIAWLVVVGHVSAESPRFKFSKGTTLTYHLVQTTKTIETLLDEKSKMPVEQEHLTKVDLDRQWKVLDVDDQGTATLAMSITRMRWEQKLPTGETDVFDSTKPDELNQSEMAKNVGTVLATLRVDRQGKLVEVKESKIGPASRFTVDLPFKLVLPEDAATVGSTWDRQYTIQLDPPLGTGEKYPTAQTYKVLEPQSGLLTLNLRTTIKDEPTTTADQIPLLRFASEGTLYFDSTNGRYYAARLKMQKELKNHQGEGTSYKYASTYVEDFIPAK